MVDNNHMFILAKQLSRLPVMSLQTGQPVAVITGLVVDMAKLEVMALKCKRGRDPERVILARDIRQFASDCVIIDSDTDIEDPAEIVRLHEVWAAGFNPTGKMVVNESGLKLGLVEDYTINLDDSQIQKLYVHQSPWRSLLFNSLVVDRTQIIDISPTRFVVHDANVKQPLFSAKTLPDSLK